MSKIKSLYDYIKDVRKLSSDEDAQEYIDKHIKSLICFLEKNKEEPHKYNLNYLKRIIKETDPPKERLYYLFVSSITSPAKPRLQSIGKGCKEFYEFLSKFFNNGDFNNFVESLKKFNEHDTEDKCLLFELIDKFSGQGPKTSALFIRDLDAIQKDLQSLRIFNDDKSYEESKYKPQLFIPVDRVIAECLSKILKLEGEYKLDAQRHFDMINKWAIDLANKGKISSNMLIEGLWYWGYFNTKNSNRRNVFEFNDDKYYSDKYRYPEPNGNSYQLLAKFLAIINNNNA